MKYSVCYAFLGRFSDSSELDYAESQVLVGFRISYSSLTFPRISSPNKCKIVFNGVVRRSFSRYKRKLCSLAIII